MKKLLSISLSLILFSSHLVADEGMWLPSEISKKISDMQAKGLKLSAEDLYSINRSSLKDGIVLFGRGCTGELISDQGLLITNHHCGYGQIQSHSSVEHDYLTNGFWAMTRAEELPNEGLSVKFLVRMEDVSDKVLSGYDPEGMDEMKRLEIIAENSEKIISEAEKEGIGYEADILPLYYGNVYYLYLYQVFTDVRLVGAPPSSIGKFGGDTDNWMWPRHTGDFSIFRIYADKNNNPAPYSEENVPYTPKRFFKISTKGLNEGDFTFVYGFPGSTREYIVSNEVDYAANISNPHKIALRTKRLDIQRRHMESSPEIRIKYASKNAGVANAWKKWQGESKGINKLGTVAAKQRLEKEFSEWALSRPEYSGVSDSLNALALKMRDNSFAIDYYNETVFTVEALRFAGIYTLSDSSYREMLAHYFFKDYHEPIDREIFEAVMEDFVLNIDSLYYPEFFSTLLSECGGSLSSMADTLFDNTLFTSYEKLSTADPLILKEDIMYRFFTAFSTLFRENLQTANEEYITKMNLLYRRYMKGLMEFDAEKVFYPDANLTLRIAYGSVAGYRPSDGVYYSPVSTIEGIMQKDDPEIYDYNIPQKLREIYAQKDYGRWAVNGTIPVAFIATNHTTGGNSGSPVIDAEGNLIGINFDRVWEGTMSDMAFDPSLCRNIALDIRYALFIIDRLAGATHLIEEMEIE